VRARAWWQRIAETGIDPSNLAALEGVSPSYIVRVLRLAFLSPAVVEAVLDGRLRAGIDSSALLNIRAIDPSWESQERRCMLRK
jgi:site-specific DNA recombinase